MTSRPHPRLAAGCAVLALLSVPAVAAPPEPALRIASQLGPARAVGEDERALLRVEWKAGRTREDEASALGEMLTRVQRMERTVAEVHRLVEAMPPAAETPPATAAPAESVEAQMTWWLLGAGAVAALLFLFRLARRRPAAPKRKTMATDQLTPIAAEPPPAAAPRPPPEREGPVLPAEEPVTIQEDHLPPRRPAGSIRPIRPAGEAAAQAAEPEASLDGAPPAHDQAMELAEVMLSMGLAHGAAQTLEEHIRQHPRQALFHWLKLLEIYRDSGMHRQFEESARDLRQQFNVQAVAAGEDRAPRAAASIEDYPHITERIVELWPRPACADYLKRLLEDNRGGTRTGFPTPVAEEILLLLRLLGRA